MHDAFLVRGGQRVSQLSAYLDDPFGPLPAAIANPPGPQRLRKSAIADEKRVTARLRSPLRH